MAGAAVAGTAAFVLLAVTYVHVSFVAVAASAFVGGLISSAYMRGDPRG